MYTRVAEPPHPIGGGWPPLNFFKIEGVFKIKLKIKIIF
jgi:hypothetical protein